MLSLATIALQKPSESTLKFISCATFVMIGIGVLVMIWCFYNICRIAWIGKMRLVVIDAIHELVTKEIDGIHDQVLLTGGTVPPYNVHDRWMYWKGTVGDDWYSWKKALIWNRVKMFDDIEASAPIRETKIWRDKYESD